MGGYGYILGGQTVNIYGIREHGGRGINGPCGVVLMFSSKRSELNFMFILQRGVLPFPLRFKEEGEGVTADSRVSKIKRLDKRI